MTTDTQTLTEFLLARIAQDEDGTARHYRDLAEALRNQGMATTADWLTQQSARVLAECEAKRRIVKRFQWAGPEGIPHDNMAEDNEWVPAWDTLCDLASVYTDHPDYRQEWRA